MQRHGDGSRPGPVSEPGVREGHHAIRTQGGAEGWAVRVDAEEALGGEGPSERRAEVAAGSRQREEACGGARAHGSRKGVADRDHTGGHLEQATAETPTVQVREREVNAGALHTEEREHRRVVQGGARPTERPPATPRRAVGTQYRASGGAS